MYWFVSHFFPFFSRIIDSRFVFHRMGCRLNFFFCLFVRRNCLFLLFFFRVASSGPEKPIIHDDQPQRVTEKKKGMCFFSVGLLIYRQPNRPPPSLSNCTYCELTTNIDAELVCVWGGGGTYWGQTTENVTSFLATETKERYGITDTRRMSM